MVVGGLGVAVVALIVAIVVLAVNGSDDSTRTVVVGSTAPDATTTQRDSTEQTDPVPASAHPGPDNLPTQYFETPSGNIVCALSSTEVRCDIDEKDWTPYIPQPASCHLDWGNSVAVGAYGPSEFLCAGDTLLTSAEGELGYGYVIGRGRIKCISRESGLTCLTPAGSGFFLSQQRVKLF
jgi:hypothetical protein